MSDTNNFDAIEHYGEININFLYPFNANGFSLVVNVAALSMESDMYDHDWLGTCPVEKYPFTAKLIDFESNAVVQTITGNLGDTIEFKDITNGTYYYLIECDGFHAAVPSNPFRLQTDPQQPKDVLAWHAAMISTTSTVNNTFDITVLTSNGIPVTNTTVNIRVLDETNPEPSTFSHWTLKTNDDGRVCVDGTIDGVEYLSPATFQLLRGNKIEMWLEGYNKFVPVDTSSSDCVFVVP